MPPPIALESIEVRGPTASGVMNFDGVRIPVAKTLSPTAMREVRQHALRKAHMLARGCVGRAVERHRERFGEIGRDDVGFLKKISRLAKKVVRTATPKFVRKLAEKAAKSKLGRWAIRTARNVARAAKATGRKIAEIAKHPAFQATVFAVSQIVPGAQGLGYIYVAAMAALKVAEGLARRDPNAVKALGAYATQAANGDPAAKAVIDKFNELKGTLQTPTDVAALLPQT